jgi:alpha-D-xyloside xylohydrolase
MFGPDILVAPVVYEGIRSREVYLPVGNEWREVSTGKIFTGGVWVESETPLDILPLFTRDGKDIL